MPNERELELYIDGGSRGNPGPAAAAWVVKDRSGKTLVADAAALGRATNNVAEYTALVNGLRAVREQSANAVRIFSDSELLVRQLLGQYRVRSADLRSLFEEAQLALLSFDRWQIRHVPREQNREADALVNETLDREPGGPARPVPAGPADTYRSDAKVLVEVVGDPADEACPAGLRTGLCFVFSTTVPAGLCLHAASALIPEALRLQSGPRGGNGAVVTVFCPRPGCRTTFNLSLI